MMGPKLTELNDAKAAIAACQSIPPDMDIKKGSSRALSPMRETTVPVGIRLERESSSIWLLLSLAAVLIVLDLIRQLCSYGMKYHNEDRFPLPFTFLIMCTESAKLVVFFTKMLLNGTLGSNSISFAYLVPSTIYALNNNIYFIALNYTTPPVWNILMQSRVVCTALVYRFFFKKNINAVQWLALVVLTSAIVILQTSGGVSLYAGDKISWNVMIALGLAIIASIFSSIGPVYTEYLFKHDKRSFDDKQLQIYLFGTIVTGSFFLLDQYTKDGRPAVIDLPEGSVSLIMWLVIVWGVTTVIGGIMIAIVIKKLDNIVKLYTQAVSNALTAMGCVVLFPRTFSFDSAFLVSFALTLVAIYLYEAKTLPCWDRVCKKGTERESTEA